jgi:hypothetical protein
MPRAAIRVTAALRSPGAAMWSRLNAKRGRCPVIGIATFSGVPSLTWFRTAVHRPFLLR